MRKIGLSLLFIFLTLAMAEAVLRIEDFILLSETARARNQYVSHVFKLIYSQWLNTDQVIDPFSPPFLVFSNQKSNDDERLNLIFELTRLPPNKTWTSFDFIQGESKRNSTQYKITSNNFGFRGSSYSKEKPKGTLRGIVLGSYHAFGHGVDDEQTYSARTEFLLNQKFGSKKRKFEIWNGGRHAGTAIIGLARIKNEIFDYDPDFLILDYGFIDSLVWGDNVFPGAMRLPDSEGSRFFRKMARPIMPLLGESILWQKMTNAFFMARNKERKQQYAAVMNELFNLTRAKQLPIILLQQLSSDAVPPITTDSSKDKIFRLSVETIFKEDPPNYPSPNEWTSEKWSPTWLTDFQKEWDPKENFAFYPYRLNLFQLNKYGHEAVAKSLTATIASIFKLTLSQKAN